MEGGRTGVTLLRHHVVARERVRVLCDTLRAALKNFLLLLLPPLIKRSLQKGRGGRFEHLLADSADLGAQERSKAGKLVSAEDAALGAENANLLSDLEAKPAPGCT